MLRIANPIYDSVFKHLMEHQEVAKGLLSCLLGLKITELTPCPQEISDHQVVGLGYERGSVRVFRIDFSAVIRLTDGTEKRVLIELQKASNSSVTERFRYYLGKHYAIPATQAPVVPIVAIYILGYWLDQQFPVVTRVKRHYLNALTDSKVTDEQGKILTDPFIENLSHDAVVVQIPAIQRDCSDHPTDPQAAELAMSLQLFNQHLRGPNHHFLTLSEAEVAHAPMWLKEMLRLLTGAAADEATQNQMRLEDEFTTAWDDMMEKLATETKEKEQALTVQAEERRLKEEERRLKEEERGLKEDERRQKEEQRRLKEEALSKLAEMETLLAEFRRKEDRDQ
jgi:hypothetical protein